MNKEKSKLFRKVNTKAFNIHHNFGGDFKNTRNSKKETLEQSKGKMFEKRERVKLYPTLQISIIKSRFSLGQGF